LVDREENLPVIIKASCGRFSRPNMKPVLHEIHAGAVVERNWQLWGFNNSEGKSLETDA